MNTITFLFLAGLILVNSFIAQSSQEAPELKEATALTESVVTLFNERKFDEALPPAKRALEIRERLLTPGDPQISTSLSYLADIYIARRSYGDARKFLLRLIANQEKRLGPEDIGLAATLDRVALLHRRVDDSARAEEAYKRAIALKEKAFGTDNVEVARSLAGLAEVYRDRKDFRRASPIYDRVLLIYGKSVGIKSVEFESTSEAYTCLGYETNKQAVAENINQIWNQFMLPDDLQEAPPSRVLNGVALSLPRPEYPGGARERRLEGTVIVKVMIDETGRVIEAHDMCHGPAYLSQASVNAARLALFSPTKIAGMPVKVTGVIRYNFVNRRW
jgi:TonB family protein